MKGIMNWRGTNKKLREILFSKNKGKCSYCKKDLILETSSIKPPNNLATIEHTKSKFFRKKHDVVLKIIACYQCNQKKSYEEQRTK